MDSSSKCLVWADRYFFLKKYDHIGGGRLYDLLSVEYWWPHMRQDCVHFTAHCLNCQLEKGVYSRESNLEHLPLPVAARSEWHLDLAPDLPTS